MNKTFTFHFDMNHFIQVLNVRENRGIYNKRIRNNEIFDHPLKGKKVFCLDSDKEYFIVDRVHKMWHLGYYIVLMLVDENNSHRVIEWENISCREPIILESIEKNKKILQFCS